MREIAVLGAGGLAREVACLILDICATEEPRWVVKGLVEAGGGAVGSTVGRWEVFATDDQVDLLPDSLAIGIGLPSVRLAVGDRFASMGFGLPSLVHPTVVIGDAKIADGAVICAGNVITTNVRIERFAYVNLACTIGHDSVIGAGVNMSPGVNVSGDVQIGDGTLVGTGATILQGIRIGQGAIVGAGAMVRADVPDGVTVVGVPARPLGNS